VTRFEAGNYAEAAQAFASAMSMAPNDMILPFAYAQALFANGQYSEAAEALRAALKNASPEQEGVFYPRGLYAQDEVLFGQLEKLLDKVDAYGFDADLQLLLGYHLLGVGEMEYARGPLEQAGQDIRNAQAAKVLLNVLNKQEAAGTTGGAAGSQGVSGAGAVTPDAAAPATSSKSNVLERVKGSASEDANQQAPVEKTTPNLDPNTHYGQMVPVNAGRQESPAKEEDDVPSPR